MMLCTALTDLQIQFCIEKKIVETLILSTCCKRQNIQIIA